MTYLVYVVSCTAHSRKSTTCKNTQKCNQQMQKHETTKYKCKKKQNTCTKNANDAQLTHTHKHKNTQTNKQTHKHINTNTQIQTETRKHKNTNTQKHKHKHNHTGLAWQKSSECMGGLTFRAIVWSSFWKRECHSKFHAGINLNKQSKF